MVGPVGRSTGDESVVLEHLPDLLHARVCVRKDVLGGFQSVGGEGRSVLTDPFEEVVQGLAEGRLVAGLDRPFQGIVVGVEQVKVGFGQVELTLTHDANDHEPSFWPLPPSICGVEPPPWPSSAFIRSSSDSTPVVLAIRSSSDWMSSLEPPEPVTSSRAPEASSSSTAPARACMSLVLSSARCTAMPTSPISSEIPEKASLIWVWAWAAV